MIFILETVVERIDVMVGMKCGCLQVLDDGEEYRKIIEKRISNIEEEKKNFLQAVEKGEYARRDWHGWNGEKSIITPAYLYKPVNFEVYGDSVTSADFEKVISSLHKEKEIIHYKCKCRKCGKIRYYSERTLKTEPKVCYKPMYCSSKSTYSIKASNANYNKKRKYENNEAVCLVDNKDKIVPATDYCDAWNEKRSKELIKLAEKDARTIATIPRKLAKNYNIDYVGRRYESLDVLECVNNSLESVPTPYYTQRHEKKYHDITIYKEYRCRCYLCGKEKLIKCDKFGIFPSTEYGYRAYGGYWSDVFCDCHAISSFQWIVTDILMKNGIDYRVEVSFDGVYGIDNETPLRFDFAIYKEGKVWALIECQGEQHFMPVEEFGGEHKFIIQQRNDEEKRKYAKEHKIKLIEISYKNKKYETVESILRDQLVI